MKKSLYIVIFVVLFVPILIQAKSRYLYDVIKEEAESEGMAREYTKEHFDNINTELSTYKIYHWYAENNEEGTALLDRINIIFGDHCWQMFRTTDTGGVKMIYNGEAENNQCLNTRGKHVGYVQYQEKQTISANYFYGTDYTYNKENNLFSLAGTVEQVAWNSSNSASLKGQYTCKQTTREGTCSKLYQIISYSSATQANVVPLNGNASYYEYGELALQVSAASAAGAGYMYGDPSPIKTVATINSQTFTNKRTIIQSVALNANHWFADSYDYDPSVSSHFTLVDPYKVTNAEYPNLVDKYTLRNTSGTARFHSAYHIVGVSGSTSYYRTMTYPLDIDAVTKIAFADSITDNGDGTYTLDSPELVTYIDYFSNYANYKNKYTCGNNTTTCQTPHYITETTNVNYTYLTINSGNNIVISKGRDGLNLVDTLTIDPALMIINRSNYTDYKYTCNNDSNVCEESNLRYISSYNESGYKYAPNRYFGTSVTWDEDHYVLNDIVDLESYLNLTTIKNHRYFCEEYGNKECKSIAFIHRYTSVGSNINYDLISNGTPDIQAALDIMWKKNNYDSFLKKGIDSWYEKYLIDYSDYLEDTVFCNNREVISYNGWDPAKSPNSYIYFKGSASSTWDLTCPNEEDQFQVANPKAKLKYPIAVGTAAELNLLNNNIVRGTANYYWIMTPAFVNELYGRGMSINPGGGFSTYYNSTHAMGVRPVVSLAPKTRYAFGTGSMEDPYIVDYNTYYNIDVEIKNETKDLDIEIEDITSVPEGEQVTFTVTPIKGFKITGIQIVDSSDVEIPYQETTTNHQYTFIMPGEDVTIIPSYERTAAAINVEENPHTKEIVIEVNDATAVVYEDVVRFTVEAEEGYELVDIEITDEEGNEVEYHKTSNDNEYEFIMPATDVLIKPIYKEIPKEEEKPNPIINPDTNRSLLWIGILILLGFFTRVLYKKQKMKV